MRFYQHEIIYVSALLPAVMNLFLPGSPLLIFFVIVPLVDHFVKMDLTPSIPSTRITDLPLLAWAPLLLLNLWSRPVHHPLLDTLSMGLLMGQSINIAHELIHRRDSWLHLLVGRLLLTLNGYGHWEEIHLKIHHVHVGTPMDMDSAKRGESLYSFLVSSILRTGRTALAMNPSSYAMYRAIGWFWILMTVLFQGTWYYGLYHYLAAWIGVILLETLNYIEHYGLERHPQNPIQESHSWDASSALSPVMVFKLTHHSDHHMHALKRYPELRIRQHSPKMPYNYPIMMMFAFVPSLFQSIMDPRIPSTK